MKLLQSPISQAKALVSGSFISDYGKKEAYSVLSLVGKALFFSRRYQPCLTGQCQLKGLNLNVEFLPCSSLNKDMLELGDGVRGISEEGYSLEVGHHSFVVSSWISSCGKLGLGCRAWHKVVNLISTLSKSSRQCLSGSIVIEDINQLLSNFVSISYNFVKNVDADIGTLAKRALQKIKFLLTSCSLFSLVSCKRTCVP
ncbi:ribonuclease H-like superfamily protein [Striga asiatica]|uniref:Ribonuclease H-like superfamily protein n=1 Tax=Striga asiatica TaxID=4170 RepID=A0A5A7PUK8_STRAF|nr:ribonuclease H-like superfamily protein [Striga asiatica]